MLAQGIPFVNALTSPKVEEIESAIILKLQEIESTCILVYVKLSLISFSIFF